MNEKIVETKTVIIRKILKEKEKKLKKEIKKRRSFINLTKSF